MLSQTDDLKFLGVLGSRRDFYAMLEQGPNLKYPTAIFSGRIKPDEPCKLPWQDAPTNVLGMLSLQHLILHLTELCSVAQGQSGILPQQSSDMLLWGPAKSGMPPI